MFAYYSFIVSLLVALATGWKKLLVLTGRYPAGDLLERLGQAIPPGMAEGKGILISAVSIGEVAEAESLVRSIARDLRGAQFVLATGNPDGRVRAGQLRDTFDPSLTVVYLPWDRKRHIKKWLNGFRPGALVTLETDIWPNLFRACNELGIPVFIVNGRVYPKDVWRYKLARLFFKRVLSCVTWIGVQSKADFDRFRAIGADPSRMDVVGNLKFASVPTIPLRSDPRLDSVSRIREKLLVAGSTHDPEEKWILGSFTYLRNSGRNVRLVLAPRNVRRSASVLDLARSMGFRVARWSAEKDLDDPWDVMVLDQVGWLPSIYSLRPVLIMGGTFARKGGHNIAEAAAHGCAVLVGPNVGNFQEMVDEFHLEGGVVKTETALLARALDSLLTDNNGRESIGDIGRRVVLRHSGCSDRYAMSILARLRVGNPATAGLKDGGVTVRSVSQSQIRPSRKQLTSNWHPFR